LGKSFQTGQNFAIFSLSLWTGINPSNEFRFLVAPFGNRVAPFKSNGTTLVNFSVIVEISNVRLKFYTFFIVRFADFGKRFAPRLEKRGTPAILHFCGLTPRRTERLQTIRPIMFR
jgi:hypothetical protein